MDFKVGDTVVQVGKTERYTVKKILDDRQMLMLEEFNFPVNPCKYIKVAPIISEGAQSLDGGGKRFNSNKPRVELLVPEAMIEEAKVWAMGAEKYGDFNWQRGMKYSTVIACLMRHIFAILKGEDFDKESGLLHAAHIKTNASMLIYYHYYYKQGDDREKRVDVEE